MKFLLVIDSLGSGGAQRQFTGIACGLRSMGHEIVVLTYYDYQFFGRKLNDLGIKHLCIEKNSRWSISPVFNIRRLAIREKFDAILSFLDTPNFYCELALLGIGDIGLVVSERSSYTVAKPSIWRAIMSQFHRRADFVTTNSFYHKAWLSKNYPWLVSRLYTIYNGIEFDKYSHGRTRIPQDCLRLLGVGRISAAKNIPRLIEALAVFRNEARIDLTIAWCGRTDSLEVKDEADKLLREMDVEQYWTWHGEIDDIPATMVNYHALILPSLWEGLPNVLCESLASGLPVLASRISDVAVVIEEGVTGYLFNPNSVGDIVQAIQRFSETDEFHRTKMSMACRLYAELNFSMERCYRSYEALLIRTLRKNELRTPVLEEK